MNAILTKYFGEPDQLYIGEVPRPTAKPKEVLVKVHATALNRADTLQRRGQYPPPPGVTDILGLEMSGEIIAIGDQVSQWNVGDRVCGLLAGGGYAEYVCIHEDLALEIPEGYTYPEAAAIPEVFLTAFQAIVSLAHLQKGERILIHAGASGVGTAAIQLSRLIGAEIITTASSSKHDICYALGADHVIDYKADNFAEAVKNYTEGKGVDVIIDFIAAQYFHKNIDCLGMDGRMVMLAFLGGTKVDEVSLVPFLSKRIKIMGSTLRARSIDYKASLISDFKNNFWSRFSTGELKPVIDSIYPWTDVANAHSYMEANKNQGKIVLKVI